MNSHAIDSEARAKIDAHEKVCAERYKQFISNQDALQRDLEHHRQETRENFEVLFERFWKVAVGVIGFLAGILVLVGMAVFKIWMKVP